MDMHGHHLLQYTDLQELHVDLVHPVIDSSGVVTAHNSTWADGWMDEKIHSGGSHNFTAGWNLIVSPGTSVLLGSQGFYLARIYVVDGNCKLAS